MFKHFKNEIQRNWNPSVLLVEMENGAAAVENGMMIPQKIKRSITIRSSNSAFGYISERSESWDWNKYLHTHIHSSVIYNSRKVKQPKYALMEK